MSHENDPQVTFKIQNMSITTYSCSAWQTIFGTIIVTYILYRKIKKGKAVLTKGTNNNYIIILSKSAKYIIG